MEERRHGLFDFGRALYFPMLCGYRSLSDQRLALATNSGTLLRTLVMRQIDAGADRWRLDTIWGDQIVSVAGVLRALPLPQVPESGRRFDRYRSGMSFVCQT